MMRMLAGLVVVLALCGGQASAGEGVRRVSPGWDDARGCYAYRGRMHCSRFCWRDINGHRYCHEREREAVPHTRELFERARPRYVR